MSPLRLVMVTRRFWPLVGGSERAMANLAGEFGARDVEVTLLTAKWESHWPAEILYRDVPVVRLPNPGLRFWGTIRYMQSLGRWLRENEERFDLVCVSMLKHDAYAAITAVGDRVPVVLRAAGAGVSGDCMWQVEANCGLKIKRRCMRAEAFVGPSEAIRRELIAAGYPRDRVHHMPNGVPIAPVPGIGAKANARQALATANRALSVPSSEPLAVYTGRLDEAKGLGHLVAAWESVVARWPHAQLWLAGEGPYGTELKTQIEARCLGGRVVLAGVFDNVDELLTAADLFVLPSFEEGMSVALLEAMAAGLPVVASRIPGNEKVVTDSSDGLLVPAKDTPALAAAILRVFDEPELATRLGAAARETVVNRFSLAKMADNYLELFERLIHEKREQNSR